MTAARSNDIYPIIFQNLLLYRVHAFDNYPGLTHTIFTRVGGFSREPYQSLNLSISTGDNPAIVKKNFERACHVVNIVPEQTVSCRLVHGTDIVTVDKNNQQPVMGQADGLITDSTNIYLFMRFGDCTPLLFYDPVRGVVGSTHAGWRGTMQNAAGATIGVMVNQFGCRPKNIVAVIGPAIGPCCYEVGPDVVSAAEQAFSDSKSLLIHHNGNGSRPYFDLWEANRRQLSTAGVGKIIQTGLCTGCHTDKFFSHRAEHGRTGRFGTVIGLRREPG